MGGGGAIIPRCGVEFPSVRDGGGARDPTPGWGGGGGAGRGGPISPTVQGPALSRDTLQSVSGQAEYSEGGVWTFDFRTFRISALF